MCVFLMVTSRVLLIFRLYPPPGSYFLTPHGHSFSNLVLPTIIKCLMYTKYNVPIVLYTMYQPIMVKISEAENKDN